MAVIGSAVVPHISGEVFDLRLVGHILEVCRLSRRTEEVAQYFALAQLKQVAEAAKMFLSVGYRSAVEIPDMGLGSCRLELQRQTFEDLCEDLFKSAVSAVSDVMLSNNISSSTLTTVRASSHVTNNTAHCLADYYQRWIVFHTPTGSTTLRKVPFYILGEVRAPSRRRRTWSCSPTRQVH